MSQEPISNEKRSKSGHEVLIQNSVQRQKDKGHVPQTPVWKRQPAGYTTSNWNFLMRVQEGYGGVTGGRAPLGLHVLRATSFSNNVSTLAPENSNTWKTADGELKRDSKYSCLILQTGGTLACLPLRRSCRSGKWACSWSRILYWHPEKRKIKINHLQRGDLL